LATLIIAASGVPIPKLNPQDAANHWAVVVAGSYTWGNYRHQADACHTWQILTKNGFLESNIIIFMYDDLAQSTENPTKGVIINRPNGTNVYPGTDNIDYKSTDVTPQKFLKVLKGDATAGGKVLKSDSNSNVFIFFTDHGGPGIIAFPTELLSNTDLNAALKYMSDNKMYNQLLFYLEACESGSMFADILPANINIYATTASDPSTSSYACYYDSYRNTYLGDVYSVNWMEDSDKGNLHTEAVGKQFDIVKAETNTSVVCEYGDLSIKTDTLSEFQANQQADSIQSMIRVRPPVYPNPNLDAVDSRQVQVEILRRKVQAARTIPERAQAQAALDAELNKRTIGRQMFVDIVGRIAGADKAESLLTTKVATDDYTCTTTATKKFHELCFNLGQDSWALEYTMAFVSLCNQGVTADQLVASIAAQCPQKIQF